MWRGPPRGAQGEGQGPAAFVAALAALEQAPGRRVGRLELVAAALAAMPALGVARDREAYHRLLRLLPRGVWVPRGPFQRLLAPFPRQQECGLQILEQMERYGGCRRGEGVPDSLGREPGSPGEEAPDALGRGHGCPGPHAHPDTRVPVQA